MLNLPVIEVPSKEQPTTALYQKIINKRGPNLKIFSQVVDRTRKAGLVGSFRRTSRSGCWRDGSGRQYLKMSNVQSNCHITIIIVYCYMQIICTEKQLTLEYLLPKRSVLLGIASWLRIITSPDIESGLGGLSWLVLVQFYTVYFGTVGGSRVLVGKW